MLFLKKWLEILSGDFVLYSLFYSQTNDALDVGQNDKKVYFQAKTGVVTTKGIFFVVLCP